jgi:hypothetical protein
MIFQAREPLCDSNASYIESLIIKVYFNIYVNIIFPN